MKILVIGPSIEKSKGGMASVIRQISEDDKLNNEAEIDIFSSFRDGPFVIRLIYSLVVFFKFTLICSNYDLIHLHMASYGSTRRKMVYYQWARKRKSQWWHIFMVQNIKNILNHYQRKEKISW